MAHPFAEHRQTRKEHSRVGHITKGYAKGGAVHEDAKEDRKLIKKMMKHELHADGGKSKHRADRPHRAKGGKVKGKHNAKTIVNVISGGHPAGGAVPPMPAPPMGVGPAAMPPPAMAAKPPMPIGPPPGAGGMPPGGPMPMRAKGGKVRRREDGGRTRLAGDVVDFPISMKESDAARTSAMRNPPPSRGTAPPPLKGPGAAACGGRIERAKGGGVKAIGQHVGTKVQHDKGKNDGGSDQNRGRVVTFNTGGGVRSFRAYGGKCEGQTPTRAKGGRVGRDAVAPATKLPGGSGGGEARLVKAHRAERRG